MPVLSVSFKAPSARADRFGGTHTPLAGGATKPNRQTQTSGKSQMGCAASITLRTSYPPPSVQPYRATLAPSVTSHKPALWLRSKAPSPASRHLTSQFQTLRGHAVAATESDQERGHQPQFPSSPGSFPTSSVRSLDPHGHCLFLPRWAWIMLARDDGDDDADADADADALCTCILACALSTLLAHPASSRFLSATKSRLLCTARSCVVAEDTGLQQTTGRLLPLDAEQDISNKTNSPAGQAPPVEPNVQRDPFSTFNPTICTAPRVTTSPRWPFLALEVYVPYRTHQPPVFAARLEETRERRH
ncbi:hypothetical protein B0T22DRAFT_251722 [Podospora appendiculata]|uniref:Uncharacterized protein n=1 Tax=Podospora appendiculata TaxID=314037 RepID=A0AAE0X2H7_9PEZI|nr:hypothetical protein B0T22DRAFT_251722 [Podospora appendiculata]